MGACLICLGTDPPDSADGRYHVACLQRLFGTDTLPRINLDLAHFPALIGPEFGNLSISGMQRKALVRLSNDKKRLGASSKATTTRRRRAARTAAG